jgi:serine/threonine-protein kinase
MTLQLQTLGALDLAGDAPNPGAVLRQPKRLALLVYLAAAGDRFVRRDTLLGLFWPELDQEHARAALRRALYFLRQALGDGAIEGRGDEELRVAPGHVELDVHQFDAAMRAGAHREALALYHGDFLAGLYVAGAAELEHWIDAERERLRAQAMTAAWELAEDAATPVREAMAWASRAAAIAGDDERAEERRQRLVARLGAGPGQPRDEIVLMIRPFDTRDAGAFEYLGEGIIDLLAASLDGLDGLRVADPRALLTRSETAFDDAVHRLGATHVLDGILAATADGLELRATLRALTHDREEPLKPERASEARLFDLVDGVSRQLIDHFAARPGEQLTQLASRTTTSFAALKAWLSGEHYFRLGQYREAAAAFDEAAGADAEFALAHYRSASAHAAMAEVGEARTASNRAWQRRDRLSEHPRRMVEAQSAWLRGESTEAERHYRGAVAAHPDDAEAWYLLGDVLWHGNPYRGRSIREAREPLTRALELDPTHLGALAKLARLDALERHHADLDARVTRFLSLSPDADQAIAMRSLRAWTLRRMSDKLALIGALRHTRPLSMAIAFGDVALYSRSFDELEPIGRAMLTAIQSPDQRALARLMLAHLLLAQGKAEAAGVELDGAVKDAPAWGLPVRAMLTAMPWWSWKAAFADRARSELEAYDAEEAPDAPEPLSIHNGLHRHIRAFVLGLLDARDGNDAAMMQRSEELAELEVPPSAQGVVTRMVRLLQALLAHRRGDSAKALAALGTGEPGEWYQFAVGSPVFAGCHERILRAQWLAQDGRVEEAAGWLAAIGERSPWELPFVVPAQAALSKLTP